MMSVRCMKLKSIPCMVLVDLSRTIHAQVHVVHNVNVKTLLMYNDFHIENVLYDMNIDKPFCMWTC